MLDLLSLLIFYKNKDTFETNRKVFKKKEKKDEKIKKKRKDREVTKMTSPRFLLNVFRIVYAMVLKFLVAHFLSILVKKSKT